MISSPTARFWVVEAERFGEDYARFNRTLIYKVRAVWMHAILKFRNSLNGHWIK